MRLRFFFASAPAVLVMVRHLCDPLELSSQSLVPRTQSEGVAYSIRVTTRRSVTGVLETTNVAATGDWAGTAVIGPHRGRIDVIDGGLPELFTRGDYILFDAQDVIAVRAADKSFKGILHRELDSISTSTNPAGVSTTLSNLMVSVDSLLPPAMIDGKESSRYRITYSYVVRVDLSNIAGLESVSPSTFETTQTTDYYFANVIPLPPLELPGTTGPRAQLLVPSHLRELSVLLAAANKNLPRDKLSLKTVSTTRIVGGDMSSVRETTTEISQIRSQTIDAGMLILPSDYTQVMMPGASPGADVGGKWRRPPMTP